MTGKVQILGAVRVALPGGGHDEVVLEAPLVLEAGGGQVVTMRTPMGEQADLDWAIGFLASEGVIAGMADVVCVEWVGSDPVIDPMPPIADTVRVKLAASIAPEKAAVLRRGHEMRASCGICGVESPSALAQALGRVPHPCGVPDAGRVEAMLSSMRERQALFLATGACHGAAVFDARGALVAVAEDIGRHNALDRVIGQCLRGGSTDLADATLALSGRAGYELVVKAIRVGIPAIVSVGAASSFAVELARASGVRLVGFARGGGAFRVYS